MQMHDCKHDNPLRPRYINNAIRETAQTSPANFGAKGMPCIGITNNQINNAQRFQQKRVTQPRHLGFVPGNCLIKFALCRREQTNWLHKRYLANT